MKFKKKPVVIEAEQWDGTRASKERIEKVFCDLVTNSIELGMNNDWEAAEYFGWTIYTLEGLITAAPGDWIIKGVKGEFYPCKPDIFKLTYEEVYEHQSTY